jgi:putative hemolysin
MFGNGLPHLAALSHLMLLRMGVHHENLQKKKQTIFRNNNDKIK